MQNLSETKNDLLLKGKENYLAWATRLEIMLVLDDLLERDEESNKLKIKIKEATEMAAKEKLAMKFLIKNCSDVVMHTIDPSATFLENLAKLNKQYGAGNLDPAVILKSLRDVNFHPSKDPAGVIDEFNRKLVELESAGGAITQLQMVQYH